MTAEDWLLARAFRKILSNGQGWGEFILVSSPADPQPMVLLDGKWGHDAGLTDEEFAAIRAVVAEAAREATPS